MSLWTPDGERPIRRDQPAPTAPSGPGPVAGPGTGGGATPGSRPASLDEELARLDPEQRAEAEAMLAEMARVQEELATAPAADVIANHLMGFYELAAIHLNQDPPHFAEAAVAIDALRSVVGGLGNRLGRNEAPLTQALQQIQMAFVQLKRAADEADRGPADADSDA